MATTYKFLDAIQELIRALEASGAQTSKTPTTVRGCPMLGLKQAMSDLEKII